MESLLKLSDRQDCMSCVTLEIEVSVRCLLIF